jgi:restriction system protein
MQKVPAYHEMLWPTLQALKNTEGSASNHELLPKVIQMMGIPEEIQNIPHKDGPRTEVGYRLFWARYYLRKVGAIERSERGVWSITPKGRALSESAVKEIPREVREIVRLEARRDSATSSGRSNRPSDEPEPAELETVEEVPEDRDGDLSWQERLISILQTMPPDAFERLAQRILRESGFVKVEVKGKSGDGGIDGIGVLRLNLLSFQVFFQCKRYRDTVSAGAIRDFRGAMVGRTDKGLFITTGRFTPEAKKEATRDGAPPIDLIDGEQLCEILKTLRLGVRAEMVEQVSVQPDVFKNI